MLKRYLLSFAHKLNLISKEKFSKKIKDQDSDYNLLRKSELFDCKWYLDHYPDVKAAKIDPILHFLNHGWRENRNPSSLFITKFYLQYNPDIKKAQINPLLHYIRYGKKEGRNIGYSLSEYKSIKKSGYFDKRWYLDQYKDVFAQNMDPIIHYLLVGWAKGYNPSQKFDTNFYLNSYPDIQEAKLCPLLHYIQNGYKEGRIISNCNSEDSISAKKIGILTSVMRQIYRFIYRRSVKKNRCVKIAVHVHLFYEDLWFEIKNYLKNLECYQFDLFISSPSELSERISNDIYSFKKKTRIMIIENRGFDLGPFIYFLHKINLRRYDIIFKIHTKRNITPGNYYGVYMKGNEWRTLLYEGILGVRTVHNVINALTGNNSTGLVSHKRLICEKDAIYNKDETLRTMKLFNFVVPEKYTFIAGTMFAGRAELFQNIKDKVKFEDFPISKRGEFTLAHAFERLISLNILSQDFTIKGFNTLHWNYFIRSIQAIIHPYNPAYFYNYEMIKDYFFYKATNKMERKQFFISSLLKEKNKKLYNALIEKAKIDLRVDKPLSKAAFDYHFSLKELVLDRIVAKIVSPQEITKFKLVGDSICVEKETKQKGINILKICSQPSQFIIQGKYLLEIIESLLLSKNIKKITQELIPYFCYVFEHFKSKNSEKLNPNAWDAIPRNTIINEKGNYCFFDCNIKYLAGVPKSYFIYRVVIDLIYYATEKNVVYTTSEIVRLYNNLCIELGINGNFKHDQQLENNLQLHLWGKIGRIQLLKDFIKIVCFHINFLSVIHRKDSKFRVLDENYELLSKSKYFDKKWYTRNHPEVAASNLDPLYYWLTKGWKKNQDPSKLFSVDYYLTRYPDIKAAKVNPLVHYIKNGKKEGRLCNLNNDYHAIKKSKFFDKEWYCSTYSIPDGMDPYKHYLTKGYLTGNNPSPLFDSRKYLAVYPDVLKSKMNPLAHWELKGKYETTRTYFTPDSKPEYIFPKDYKSAQNRKKILLVSHVLNHTGAPILLIHVAKMFKNMGYEVFVMSPKKGDLIDEFIKEDVPVIIDENCIVPNFDIELPCKFDFCICNTILLWASYSIFSRKIPTLWWIHDNVLPVQVHDLMRDALRKAKNVYVPSNLTKSYISPYNKNVKILPYPIDDEVKIVKKDFKNDRLLKISVYATLQERKGQDIFVKAVKLLPKKIRSQCIFELVGEEAQPGFKKNVLDPIASGINEIKYVKLIKNRKLYHSSLDNVDILCCPSREDPYPLVVIDALMHGCPVILSDHVGEKDIIEEMENGVVFESKNAEHLAKCLRKIIEHKDNLPSMSKRARETFLENFDYLECSKKFAAIMEEICKK